MNAKAEVQNSGMDNAKLAVAAALVVGAIFGFLRFNTFPATIADGLTNSTTSSQTVTYEFEVRANRLKSIGP